MLGELIGIGVGVLLLLIILGLGYHYYQSVIITNKNQTIVELPKQDIYHVRKSFTAPNIFKIDTLKRNREFSTVERENIKNYTRVEEQELEEILKKHVGSDASSLQDQIECSSFNSAIQIDNNRSDKSTLYTKHSRLSSAENE
ncbi:hypothetical protein HDV04_005366, partial [Boothiomyces sp. JEL0838]